MQYAQLQQDPWPTCRSWLVPYDGSASELFILDMGADRAAAVAACIEARCRLDRRSNGHGHTELNLGPSLDRLASAEVAHIAAVASFDGKPIQLYFDRRSGGLFDLEIAFWSDLLLPDSAAEPEQQRTFHALVQLALDICEQGAGRAVLISPEWPGDPRPLESSPANVIWQREP